MPDNIVESGDHDHRSVLASVGKDGRRKRLYVAVVGGFWRQLRIIVAVVLIAFYMAAPLVTINGLPMIHIDIPNRQYIFFGHIFWPQDFFYFLLLFLTGVIATVAMVSLLGRVFCGWICPHNVFLEMVYRPIERFFEGPAHRHRLNDQRGLNGQQGLRRAGKWLAFILVSGALANTATALFTGTDAFIHGLFINPVEHPAAAIFFAFTFVIILGNFAWFREQMCTIICPYGRLQSALLDSESLIVGYDHRRGEPRGKPQVVTGDCIDCFRCVDVCPTGIDIRNGTQMECIQCSACIDACNEVMQRLERPINLISYTSENTLEGKARRIVRPRTVLYGIVLSILIVVSSVLIINRPVLQMTRLRDGHQGTVIRDAEGNRFVAGATTIAMVNKTWQDRQAEVLFDQQADATVVSRHDSIAIPANSRTEHSFTVRVPVEAFRGRYHETVIRLSVEGREQPFLIPVRLQRPSDYQREGDS